MGGVALEVDVVLAAGGVADLLLGEAVHDVGVHAALAVGPLAGLDLEGDARLVGRRGGALDGRGGRRLGLGEDDPGLGLHADARAEGPGRGLGVLAGPAGRPVVELVEVVGRVVDVELVLDAGQLGAVAPAGAAAAAPAAAVPLAERLGAGVGSGAGGFRRAARLGRCHGGLGRRDGKGDHERHDGADREQAE